MSGPNHLAGRRAVVTGGLSGQGLAIARALAAAGADVAAGSLVAPASERADAAHYPDAAELERVHAALGSLGVRSHAGHLDVRDPAAIRAFLEAAAAGTGGAPDILVNAAGTTAEHGVVGHPDDLWDRILDTNLNGAFRMIRACLGGMMERGWGRIVNIGSTAATIGWRDNPAYCASKAGLLGLTRCVALEGAPRGVTCVMVSPTWVDTELMRRDAAQIAAREGRGRSVAEVVDEIRRSNPQGRILRPEEIAALVAHLCREESRGITMENIQVTGGALW